MKAGWVTMTMADYENMDPREIANWKLFEVARAMREKSENSDNPPSPAMSGVMTFGGSLQ